MSKVLLLEVEWVNFSGTLMEFFEIRLICFFTSDSQTFVLIWNFIIILNGGEIFFLYTIIKFKNNSFN